jgi:hypothetical protein
MRVFGRFISRSIVCQVITPNNATSLKKLSARKQREMKRVAQASKPPVVVPVIVVAVDVHVAIVIPPIESGRAI